MFLSYPNSRLFSVSAYPSPHSVNVYCKGVNGIYRKPLPKTGMSKEGIAVQVITAILIVTAVVAVYLK